MNIPEFHEVASWLRSRACDGKVQFTQEGKAVKVAKRLAMRGDGQLDAYLCPHCGFYHVGHSKYGGWVLKQNTRSTAKS